MNKPEKIFIHCTATPEGRVTTVDDIRGWHTAPKSSNGRGWVDIGYHKVVYLDGSVHNGRDLDNDGDVEEHVGAHAYGYNKNSLAIVYVGGVDKETLSPKDTRTPAQQQALLAEVSKWMKEFNIPVWKVYGHYEVDSGKACPSFSMGTFREELRQFEIPSTDVRKSRMKAMQQWLGIVDDGVAGPVTTGALVNAVLNGKLLPPTA